MSRHSSSRYPPIRSIAGLTQISFPFGPIQSSPVSPVVGDRPEALFALPDVAARVVQVRALKAEKRRSAAISVWASNKDWTRSSETMGTRCSASRHACASEPTSWARRRNASPSGGAWRTGPTSRLARRRPRTMTGTTYSRPWEHGNTARRWSWKCGGTCPSARRHPQRVSPVAPTNPPTRSCRPTETTTCPSTPKSAHGNPVRRYWEASNRWSSSLAKSVNALCGIPVSHWPVADVRGTFPSYRK